MKKINYLLVLTCLSAGSLIRAAEPPSGALTNGAAGAPPSILETSTNPAALAPDTALAPDLTTNTVAGTNTVADTNALAAAIPAVPPVVVETGTNGLRLNFNEAPLNLVLDYLSDAAGFIINKDTDVRGTVSVKGKDLSKDEAVEVLNTALKKNGYAVMRKGRILTIVSQDTAKTSDLPVDVGSNADDVEKGSEIVTQIIPVKYASVSQLVPNLELLLPTTATLSANESANSLILVATKTDIKRMLKIITALDTSIASVSSIRVIPLKYADAKDTATLITQLFAPAQGTQGGAGLAGGRGALFSMMAAGAFGRGGGPGGFGGRGGNGAGGGAGGGAAAKNVVAVGDDRSNSIIISAPADIVTTIETMVKEIDQEVTDVSELQVFRLVNADASEVADQLATLFPDPTTSNTANQGPMAFFFRGGRGGNTAATANTSERMKKMSRVLAVPDPRTSSIIVLASKTMMPQIADMIAELDSNKGRKEVVGVFDLQNADPQDVYNNLQDLFNRTTVRQNNSANQNPMMGTANPLSQRVKSNPQATVTTSGSLGNSGGTGGSRSMGGGF
jgi:type II secretory pathway component GspD/PulD (secretin)